MNGPNDTQHNLNDKSPDTPQVYAWVASGLTVAVFVLNSLLGKGESLLFRRIAVPVLLLAVILAFLPMFALGRYGKGREKNSYMETVSVVSRGLFAVVRHPQYLGYMLFNVGFVFLSQHWLTALAGALAMIFFYLQTVAEERTLLQRFGQEYLEYAQRVPRLNILLGTFRRFRGGAARPGDGHRS